jgi:hypothetical protein
LAAPSPDAHHAADSEVNTSGPSRAPRARRFGLASRRIRSGHAPSGRDVKLVLASTVDVSGPLRESACHAWIASLPTRERASSVRSRAPERLQYGPRVLLQGALPELAAMRESARMEFSERRPCASIGASRYFGYHGAPDAWEDSHADFRIVAESLFYQNDRRCRGRHLWARRGCQSPRLQASGTEEADTGRRAISRPPKRKPKLRQLSVFLPSQRLRCCRRRDQRIRLVPHVHYVCPARSRRARVEWNSREQRGFVGRINSAPRQNHGPRGNHRVTFPSEAKIGVLPAGRARATYLYARSTGANSPARRASHRKARYRFSGSMWTILLVCWPSVHMLERMSGFELFCTSIWRVLMEVGRR